MGSQDCIGEETISKTYKKQCYGFEHCIGGGKISKTCVKQCYGLATLYKGTNNK